MFFSVRLLVEQILCKTRDELFSSSLIKDVFLLIILFSSCFAGVNPTLSVHRGEIQSPNLAMAIECWSEEGRLDETDQVIYLFDTFIL